MQPTRAQVVPDHPAFTGPGLDAAHARAGGARFAAVDQYEGFLGASHPPHGIEAGGSRADDGYVHFSFLHGISPGAVSALE